MIRLMLVFETIGDSILTSCKHCSDKNKDHAKKKAFETTERKYFLAYTNKITNQTGLKFFRDFSYLQNKKYPECFFVNSRTTRGEC